ncbi:alpha/beta hydrolase [Mycolicibacterium madagascariense]|uniref:Alpha/beta hydrolase n=1 Tax=Mycolicibacterium madagascariense TaxID=212765 RepID=A0A7I7XI93_9MYCO|nr:alpha/beta hydrolase [Mycolicibacterium madagascariense]MCV7012802.1 alpha/beta fold hydrolase [Mycolicibacterium madagascariense]BBZ28863.1 alpha/beta hydrolase [Mycolicibacterium madagascariense]
MSAIRHHSVHVEDLDVFVREAGDSTRPTLVCLPGYPSSTRAYVRLIDRLATDWHVVAIDYPGFGWSQPLPGTPTFDRLAAVTGATIDALGIEDYALYMFDFGAPVGFRIALRHDRRVRAIVTQNANAYTDGLGPGVAPLAAWWADEHAGRAAIDEFLSLAGTQAQWRAGARDVEHVDPDHALADQRVLDLPARAEYMRALLWDYQSNPPLYPDWQTWLRTRRPHLLAIWGGNDPFFVPAGALAYQRDVPAAEVVLLDTGHFALEEEADEIAARVGALLAATFA